VVGGHRLFPTGRGFAGRTKEAIVLPPPSLYALASFTVGPVSTRSRTSKPSTKPSPSSPDRVTSRHGPALLMNSVADLAPSHFKHFKI
jgi:hypothetical protein